MYQLIVAFNKINGSGPIFVRAVCWRHNWFSVVGNQENGIMNHLCYYKKYCSSFVQKHQFRFPCLKNFSPSGLRALHGTKCPLLTAFFILSFFSLVFFSPRRGCPRVLIFCMRKLIRNLFKKINPPPTDINAEKFPLVLMGC